LSYTAKEIDNKLGNMESSENKVTEINSAATDEQYPSALAVYNKIKNMGSALKKNVNGEIVRIDDSSLIESTLSINVKSKNLMPYPYYNTTKISSGVTFTDNGDGSITATGENTTGTYFIFLHPNSNYILPAGQYTFKAIDKNGSTSTFYAYITVYGSDGNIDYMDLGNGVTFELEEDTKISCSCVIQTSWDGSDIIFKPQIEKGVISTPYTPYIDVSTAKVSRIGKNLIPYPYNNTTKTMNGLTFTDNGDGSITVNGTATADAYFSLTTKAKNQLYLHKGQTYTYKALPIIGSLSTMYAYISESGDDGASWDINDSDRITFTATKSGYCSAVFNIKKDYVANNLVFKPQLEVGAIATEYEPYVECVTYSANTDGIVEGVTPLYPTTTLYENIDGLIIDVLYNTDTQTYLDNILNQTSQAIKDAQYSSPMELNVSDFNIGTLNPDIGSECPSNNRLRSRYIWVGARTKLCLVNKGISRHLIFRYDKNKSYIEDSTWSDEDIIISEECYIRILIAHPLNYTITSENMESLINNEVIIREIPQSIVERVDMNGYQSKEIYNIPSYFDEQISNAISAVKENMIEAGKAGETFIWLSDTHWGLNEGHSSSIIKKISAELPTIKNTVLTGDYIDNGAYTSMIGLMEDCAKQFANVTDNVVYLFGNHDSNVYVAESRFENNEFYTIMQKQSDYKVKYGDCYYFYFDNPTTKTRYICLDTGLESSVLSETQQTWFDSTLNETPENYNIVVFGHIIYEPATWTVPFVDTLTRTSFMEAICEICDTFNTDNSNKQVVAIFGGHCHLDLNYSSPNGIPIILIDCDSRRTCSDIGATAGTITEQCFDIVTINYNTKTIKCIRIGRGDNRIFNY
jgi:hypothetical protein